MATHFWKSGVEYYTCLIIWRWFQEERNMNVDLNDIVKWTQITNFVKAHSIRLIDLMIKQTKIIWIIILNQAAWNH